MKKKIFEDYEKNIVTYNVDEIFSTTLQFSSLMIYYLILAYKKLNALNFNNNDKLNFELENFISQINQNEMIKTGFDNAISEPIMYNALKSIEEFDVNDYYAFFQKVKDVKAGDQITFSLKEMCILYVLLYLSSISFSTSIAEIHKYFSGEDEYKDIRKIILISMKKFMENITEWVEEYNLFRVVRYKLLEV